MDLQIGEFTAMNEKVEIEINNVRKMVDNVIQKREVVLSEGTSVKDCAEARYDPLQDVDK